MTRATGNLEVTAQRADVGMLLLDVAVGPFSPYVRDLFVASLVLSSKAAIVCNVA